MINSTPNTMAARAKSPQHQKKKKIQALNKRRRREKTREKMRLATQTGMKTAAATTQTPQEKLATMSNS